MSTTEQPSRPARPVVWTLPNQITVARLVLSLAVFALIEFKAYDWALGLFTLAASTDWVDGYIARKFNLTSALGRMLDPLVDKVLICGTALFLVEIAPLSGIAAWMGAVIVGRELLVTGLRSFLEQQGTDFSASLSGKLKLLFQAVALGASLLCLGLLPIDVLTADALTVRGGDRLCAGLSALDPATLLRVARDLLIWAAVALTVVSGWIYARAAYRLVTRPAEAEEQNS